MHEFTVIVTVRNDRVGLEELLPSLEAQTHKPRELIIVDGGSDDGTMDVLDAWRCRRFPTRVLVEPGSNIAEGRDAAVRASATEWIACTDAGCRPDPGWLAALARASEHADIIGGLWIVEGETDFERIVALTHYPVPEELDDPSLLTRLSHRLFGRDYQRSQAGGRSMAFTKTAWAEVGGFPDDQYAGEDQAFTAAIINRGYRAALAKDAVVRWRPRSTWRTTAQMFFTYCRGDLRSPGRLRHLIRFCVWILGSTAAARSGWRGRAVVGLAAMAYVALPVARARRRGVPVRCWWRIPAAVALKDLSQIAGATAGAWDAARGRRQPNPNPPPT